MATVLIRTSSDCVYVDRQTADFFTSLLSPGGGVRAIIANERGAEQGICAMLERRGVSVVYLLDQVAAGKDHRQLLFLPPVRCPPWLPELSASACLRVARLRFFCSSFLCTFMVQEMTGS